MQWVSFIWTTKWVWRCRCGLGGFRRWEKFSNQFYKDRKNYTQERNQYSQSINLANLLALSLAILSLSFSKISPPSWPKNNHCEWWLWLHLWVLKTFDLRTSESGWWSEVAVESCSSFLWGGEEAWGFFGEVVGGAWEPGELILHCCNCCLVCSLN